MTFGETEMFMKSHCQYMMSFV